MDAGSFELLCSLTRAPFSCELSGHRRRRYRIVAADDGPLINK